jgi:protein-disulfide isomerase
MKNNSLLIPLAILVAGGLVAGAILFAGNSGNNPENIQGNTGGGTNNNGVANNNPPDQPQQPTQPSNATAENVRPVSAEDHLRGSLNAPVKIIEFSDLECPFCTRFHSTMVTIMDEYDGQVAWVYRHLPLESIHSNARRAAEGSECAADLGGNDAFWAYIDKVFEDGESISKNNLSSIAADIGLDKSAFESCVDIEKFKTAVDDDISDALASGGRGTPYSVVIASNGQTFVVNGAQPYESVKGIIDSALNSN